MTQVISSSPEFHAQVNIARFPAANFEDRAPSPPQAEVSIYARSLRMLELGLEFSANPTDC